MEDLSLPSKVEEEKEQSGTCIFLHIVTCCALRDGLQSRHIFLSQCILPHDQSQRFTTKVTLDNGTNFVGANTELKELISKLDKSKIEMSAANNGIR